MPIFDINGNPLAHHTNFPNDDVDNIEFGAGKNYFGKKEYPSCYLTDIEYPNIEHFMTDANYELGNYHYIDGLCDYYDYNFNRKFNTIILCNPYKFGYIGLAEGKRFFDRADQLLNPNGEIHIIGKSINKWCSSESLEFYLDNQIPEFKASADFRIESYLELNEQDEINTTYDFYQVGLQRTTLPNERIVIKRV